MAFVNAASSSFLGATSVSSPSTCEALKPKHAAAPTANHNAVKMAFSSIDVPGDAISSADASVETKALVITAAYKHVFGNAYLMDSERAELAVAESQYKLGRCTVRELVRAMGKSNAYRKRFFERSGPYRFVELNCKHFLGRGPNSQEEVSFHVQKVINDGYEAEIDSYLDSEEYEESFGAHIVPRFIFYGMYNRNDSFNRMTIMRKHWDGCSTSTVSGSTAPGKPIPAQLIMGHGGYVNGFVGVQKGLPAGFRPEESIAPPSPLIPKNGQAPLRVRIKIAENLYQVYEVPAQLPRFEPKWKTDLAAASSEKRWNGVFF